MGAHARRVAERFMAALQAFEADGRVGPLADLFAADAELSNLTHTERGRDGARRFWEAYRAAFGTVRSEFGRVAVGDGDAIAAGVMTLEWVSAGTLPTGAPVRYRGVSILEVEGDRVKRFRTYYDSAAFAAAVAAG